MIYMDHAATSWPKPPSVAQAMADFLEHAGGNPGRSGHRLSISAGRAVYEARELVADVFGATDPLRVILLPNVTYALNLVLRGYLNAGDHVITTGIEHNAVMRPLRELESQGVSITVIPCGPDGSLDPGDVRFAIRDDTRLIVASHASNVMGAIAPIDALTEIAHDAGIRILVDAAQTGGVVPINLAATPIDFLAFTGHKGLQGPTGTGGLILSPDVDPDELRPLVAGGTGSRSEFEQQPDMLPDKFESGTANSVGIAGLGAGIRHVLDQSVGAIRQHEIALTSRLLTGLGSIPGVRVYGPADASLRTAVVSITVGGLRVDQVGMALDEDFQVYCRVGLHCAPAAHRTIGTFPEGTVRLAAGPDHTLAQMDEVIAAVGRIAAGGTTRR